MSSSLTNKFYEWAAFGSGSGCSGTSLISNQTIPTNKCIPVLNPQTLNVTANVTSPLFYNVSSLSTEIPGQNITTVTISQSYYADNKCSQPIPSPPPNGILTCIPYFNPAFGVTNQTVNNPSNVISYPPGLSVM